MRKSLVAALVACAEQPLKLDARRFLTGLSSDELEFIAEFLGSCILEYEQPHSWTRAQLNHGIQRFDQSQKNSVSDRQHKMILLLEFVCRCNIGLAPVPSRAELG